MQDTKYKELGYDITLIDTEFNSKKGYVASYLLTNNNYAAFIDVSSANTISNSLELLKQKKIPYENVLYIMVTHVHLDHAGAAGVLMRHFPNAKLVVHPSGFKHMNNPEKLIQSATSVYGEEAFNKLFGQMVPIEKERIIKAKNHFILYLQGRPLLFLHTPGHCYHHYSVYDIRSHGMFTGDSFGLSYKEFNIGGKDFVFPATTPNQFDPSIAHETINFIMGYNPQQIYLTHFGKVSNLHYLAEQLHFFIDEFVNIAKKNFAQRKDYISIKADLHELLLHHLKKHGCSLSEEAIHKLIGNDIDLNAKGLACWLEKQSR